MTPWSVRPSAGWPNSAARCASASMLHAPSSSEYSEWTWRWAQDGVLREVVEDLAVEHVDHAARQIGQRLGPGRLLLEALDPAVGTRDHDAELAHVADPLHSQGGDAVVCVVGGAQRSEVDVGERIGGHHQEGLRPEVLGDVPYPAGGAQQLVLVAVGEVHSQVRAVAEALPDGLGEPVEVRDHLIEP